MSKLKTLEFAMFDLIKQARLSAIRNREAAKVFGFGTGDAKDFKEAGDKLDEKINIVVEAAEEVNWTVQ